MSKVVSDTLQRGSASEWRTVVFNRRVSLIEVKGLVRCVGAINYTTKDDGLTWVISFPNMNSRFD